jgi:hypothetical protein
MSDKTFDSLLTQTCKIERRTFSSSVDKWGANSESFSTKSSTESCLFQQRTEDIEFTRRGEKLRTRLIVFFKSSADIKEDDILTFSSKAYRVISVEDSAGQGHHIEAYVINLEN